MKAEKSKYRILAIEAHPDDLNMFYGGTIAKLAEQGNEIRVITVTTGDQSTADPSLTAKGIAERLAQEHAKVMQILGVTDQYFLEGFTNHFMYSSEIQLKLREILIREIRTYKPDTVITFDPSNVFDENPDHQMLAHVGLEAAAFAAYPLVHPEHREEGLQPHFVARALLTPTEHPNLFVDIGGDPLEKKKEAGATYQSQLDLYKAEMNNRLRSLGLNPDLEEISLEDLWFSVCESMGSTNARKARTFYQQNPSLAPRLPVEFAEAFRMYYLGVVEWMRDFLPPEYLTL